MAGFGLNLKLVLFLQGQCLTESKGFLNPPLLQAATRWQIFWNEKYERFYSENSSNLPLKNCVGKVKVGMVPKFEVNIEIKLLK